jgi:hypothetical protein
MIVLKCTRRIAELGKGIVAYELYDVDGNYYELSKEKLRESMINKEISVSNMKLRHRDNALMLVGKGTVDTRII